MTFPRQARRPAGFSERARAVLGHDQGTHLWKDADPREQTVGISYPSKSATATIPGGLSPRALALATAQNNRGGGLRRRSSSRHQHQHVSLILNNAAGTASAPQTAVVAWFVVN